MREMEKNEMAVAVEEISAIAAAPGIAPFLAYLRSLESVVSLEMSRGDDEIDLWILVTRADLNEELAIYDHAAGIGVTPDGAPIRIHVMPIDRVDPRLLPS